MDDHLVASKTGVGTPRRRPYRISLQTRSASVQRWWDPRRLAKVFLWDGWTKLTAVATTIVAVTALWFTSQTVKTTNGQYDLARDAAFTAQFAKALDQVGSSTVDTRLGGIFMLDRLSRTSVSDRPTIFDVLSSYVRLHAPNVTGCGQSNDPLPMDIQTVLNVISRRDAGGPEVIDLSGTCLANASLEGANLRGARLDRTVLARANMNGADLVGARLSGLKAQYAYFRGARLADAVLVGADLRDAEFIDVPLDKVSFAGTDLRGTQFRTTTHAPREERASRSLDAPKVELWTATAQMFGGADFSTALYDHRTYWPEGFVPVPEPNPLPDAKQPNEVPESSRTVRF